MNNHLNQALNVDELSDLEDKLKKVAELDVFQAQGFLYAVICTPKQTKPTDWLPLLLKEESISEHKELLVPVSNYMTRLAYQVRTNLSAAMPICPLVSSIDAMGTLGEQRDLEIIQSWCTGFLQALKIDKQYWFAHDKVIVKSLQLIFTLVSDDETVIERMGKQAEDLGVEGVRKKSMVLLPSAVKKLYNHKIIILKNQKKAK